jgi:thiol:disulfide interchange protein
MIPVNIAIIGAGAAAGSRRRGAALGGMYGAAIAIVYGILGLAVVLTGSRFGALNSSPLFNLIIAVIFVLLALAMFDVITIDFSRFQGRAGTESSGKGSFVLAFFMGGVAALLAGACVAPVLISVLLLSTDLYARGAGAALLLPFLLGLGMGLPWPFMGAGLSFLPKPGRWMQRVKTVFGILILGFALYYGHLAYRLYTERAPADMTPAESAEGEWLTSLSHAMAKAHEENKPVFIDFWASWCKNCLAMDKTTFKDPEVVNRLASYVKVKYQAEDLKDPATSDVLDLFGVIGLPTYIVLAPK